MIRRIGFVLGLLTIALLATAALLPNSHRISPEHQEVAYILFCAQELKFTGLENIEAQSGECANLSAQFSILSASTFKVIGMQFHQTATFEVVNKADSQSLRCFNASSEEFPQGCKKL